jgi:transcriptional regulator with XRE-family HTH domain
MMKYPNIEAERARNGMTKASMAKAIDVTPDTVTNWQLARTEIPASKIVALADLFNVTTDYLLGRTLSSAAPNG